jgi:membrane dipeptidase
MKIYSVLFYIGCVLLSTTALAQNAEKIHRKAIVADSHNDIISTCIEKNYRFDESLMGKTHSDLERMRQGGIDVQVFSIWCDGSYGKGTAFAFANREIDTLYAVAARNKNRMEIVTNEQQLKQALKKKKLAAMMGVEGGHMIEDNLNYLDSFKQRGVCYLTLTWNNSVDWATSARDETANDSLKQPKGLNEFGKKVVERMNALGIMIDVSHIGEQTFWDVMKYSTKPVIASHSNAYALCPVYRNLKDSQIIAIAKNGGVIDVNFYSGFIDSNFFERERAFFIKHKAERDSLLKIKTESYYVSDYLYNKYQDEVQAMRAPLEALINHIDYLVRLAGINHVGLGSDFDGISSPPQQLNDVTAMPLITRELLKRGYKKKEIQKILGENFLRVWKANQRL